MENPLAGLIKTTLSTLQYVTRNETKSETSKFTKTLERNNQNGQHHEDNKKTLEEKRDEEIIHNNKVTMVITRSLPKEQ